VVVRSKFHEWFTHARATRQVVVAGVVLVLLHVGGLNAEWVHCPGVYWARMYAARAAGGAFIQ
jgi:hypothetical protein